MSLLFPIQRKEIILRDDLFDLTQLFGIINYSNNIRTPSLLSSVNNFSFKIKSVIKLKVNLSIIIKSHYYKMLYTVIFILLMCFFYFTCYKFHIRSVSARLGVGNCENNFDIELTVIAKKHCRRVRELFI